MIRVIILILLVTKPIAIFFRTAEAEEKERKRSCSLLNNQSLRFSKFYLWIENYQGVPRQEGSLLFSKHQAQWQMAQI